LDEQKQDFTAEGSPPPGRVARGIPVTPKKEVKPVSRRPLAVPGDHASHGEP
jgi:hypothetical protein